MIEVSRRSVSASLRNTENKERHKMEMNDGYKQCIGPCKLIKPLTEFHRKKGGHSETCKVCKSEYDREYRAKNKDKLHSMQVAYRTANKEAINKRVRDKLKNRTPEEIQERAEYMADYYEKNKDKIKATTKRNKSAPGAKQRRNDRENERYHNDPQ